MKNLISLTLALLMLSCVTYRKCEEKFGTVHTDTIQITKEIPVTVAVVVPKDSAVIRFVDVPNKPFTQRVESGRAIVAVSRDVKGNLQAKADCPEYRTTVTKTVITTLPGTIRTINFGVHPWWRKTAYSLFFLLVGSWLAWAVRYFFVVDFEVSRRRKALVNGNDNNEGIRSIP